MKIFLLIGISVFGMTSAFADSEICVGDRVIDNSNDAGSVVEVFSNRKAKVKFDGYSSVNIKTFRELSRGVKCKGRFCVGDRVIDDSNDSGTIHEVFDNGKTKIKFDGYSSLYTKAVSVLGKGYRCVEHACVNDRVIDNSNDSGTIREVFDNGKAKVRFDGYSSLYIKTLDELGYGVTCSRRNQCRGRE